MFEFDNGYSMVRSKTVGYRFTVLDPEDIEKEQEGKVEGGGGENKGEEEKEEGKAQTEASE